MDVTGQPGRTLISRLAMLAKHVDDLKADDGRLLKPVKLVSFTPGTSFHKGLRTGKAEERALIYLLLEDALQLQGVRETAALRLLKGGVETWSKDSGSRRSNH